MVLGGAFTSSSVFEVRRVMEVTWTPLSVEWTQQLHLARLRGTLWNIECLVFSVAIYRGSYLVYTVIPF